MSDTEQAGAPLSAMRQARSVRELRPDLGYPTEAAARPKSAPGTARRALNELVGFERFA